MRYVTLLLLPFLLALGACSAGKKVSTPNDWKGSYLQWGSGGGFTGVSTTYTLLENGQIFSQTGVTDGPLKELTALDKKTTKALFAKAAALNWPEADVSDPGNMSTTLVYHGKSKSIRLVWGGGKYTPSEEVKAFYQQLQSQVSTKKP